MKTHHYANFVNTRELAFLNEGDTFVSQEKHILVRFSKFTELLGFLSDFEKRYDNVVTWTHEHEGSRIGYLAKIEKYYEE